MSLKIDRLQLEIIINNDQARKSLRSLEDELRQVTKEMRQLDKSSTEYAQKAARLNSIKQQMDAIYESIGIAGLSLKELANRQRELNLIMSHMDPRLPEYKQLQEQYKQIGARIAELKGKARDTGASITKVADTLNRFQTMIFAGVAAISGFVVTVQNMLRHNAELSDSMADVAKGTGMTMAEVKELNKEIRKIDTRTGRKELLDLAYVAGKLGYNSKNDVLGFVRAADQIGIALSKDLGGNVEEAVNNLGKIADVFKVKDQFGIEQALLKTGSAINSLGAASTANEAYIVDFTKRLGGIAPQAGISVENVLGLGATLDQFGQQSEMAATAVSQLITKMFKDPAAYAKIAGISVSEFSTLLKTDANEALLQLLTGLQKNKGGLTELASKFGDLGIDGTRAIGVIGVLANNVDTLRETQKLSNEEFQKGTSLTKEFNIKNDNMAANLAKVGRGLMAAFVNTDIMNGLDSIISRMAAWFEIPLSRKIEDERVKVNMLASELLEANVPVETRNKLYNELKSLAPDVLEGIDKEAIAVDTLRMNLEKYNEQMINRIIIQKQQEVIDKANEKVAANREDRVRQEQEVRKKLTQLYTEAAKRDKEAAAEINKINTDATKTILEKAEAVNKFINDYQSKNNKVLAAPGSLVGQINVLKIYADEEREAQLKVNQALTEKQQLMTDLGVSAEATTGKAKELKKELDNGGKIVPGDGINDTSDAYTRLSGRIQELTQKLRVLRAQGKPLPEGMQAQLVNLKNQLFVIDEDIENIGKNVQALTFNWQELEQAWDTDTLKEIRKEFEELGEEIWKTVNASVSEDSSAYQERFNSELQRQKDWKEARIAMTQEVADTTMRIMSNADQVELDRKISNIERLREKELSNKKLTEKQKDAINKKYDDQIREEKQKAWERQRNADAVSTTIATILAVMRAGGPQTPPGAVAALAGAAGVIEILAQPVPEFYGGKYLVTGKQTGNHYQADYTGPAQTGIYTKPSLIGLVGEKGPEIIIDPATTRNLQMNYPEVIRAIHYARVPQFASGSYPDVKQVSTPSIPGTISFDEQTLETLKRFSEVMDEANKNGIRGNWSLFDLEKIQKDKATLESATDL